MTSPSSNSQRRRVAWLIGVVVIVGVGAVTWLSWDSLVIEFHTERVKKYAQGFIDESYTETQIIKTSIHKLLKIGDAGEQALLKLMDHPVWEIRATVGFNVLQSGLLDDQPENPLYKAAQKQMNTPRKSEERRK